MTPDNAFALLIFGFGALIFAACEWLYRIYLKRHEGDKE